MLRVITVNVCSPLAASPPLRRLVGAPLPRRVPTAIRASDANESSGRVLARARFAFYLAGAPRPHSLRRSDELPLPHSIAARTGLPQGLQLVVDGCRDAVRFCGG